MAPALPRTRFNSAELVRLLAELTPAQVPDATQTLAERLGQWLGWTDAIALSAALHADAAPVPPAAALAGVAARAAPLAAASAADAAQRVRQALERAIAADPLWAAQGPRPAGWADDAQDLAAYRRQYRGHQQAMAQALGPLRARLRSALAARSAALGQLAALDAVLEQALAARERQCLAAVPELLMQHGLALQQAEAAAAAMPAAAGTPPQPAWVARLAGLVPMLLRAELALRWQPIDGLLAALAQALAAGAPPAPAAPELRKTDDAPTLLDE